MQLTLVVISTNAQTAAEAQDPIPQPPGEVIAVVQGREKPLTSAELTVLLEEGESVFIFTDCRRTARSFLASLEVEQKWPLVEAVQLAGLLFPEYPATELSRINEELGLPPVGDDARDRARCLLELWPRLLTRLREMPLGATSRMIRLLRPRPTSGLLHFLALPTTSGGVPASETISGKFEDLFSPIPSYPPRDDAVPEEERSTPTAEQMENMFSSNGPFATLLPGYEPRPEQARMSTAVAETLGGKQHLMVEAGTGTGKSLAYLVPAAWYAAINRTPVVISTNTLNLQSQLFKKDLPLVHKALDVPFRAALIKGRRNYLCLRKLSFLLRHADLELEIEQTICLAGVLNWGARTKSGDLDECALLSYGMGPGMRSRLSSSADECGGPSCSFCRFCFMRKARRAALAADIVVANHALVFADLENESSRVLPAYAHLIFDEAHNLEDAATSHLSVEASWLAIRYALNRLWRPRRGRKARGLLALITRQLEPPLYRGDADLAQTASAIIRELIAAIATAESPCIDFFQCLRENLLTTPSGTVRNCLRLRLENRPESIWHEIEAVKGQAIAHLGKIRQLSKILGEAMREMSPDSMPDQFDLLQDLDGAVEQVNGLIQAMEFVLDPGNQDYVYWVERFNEQLGGTRAMAAPIEIGQRLADTLYAAKDSVIFTSATLSVRGSNDFFRQRVGADKIPEERLKELTVGSPFDYTRQCLTLAPSFLPQPGRDDESYTEELCLLLADVFHHSCGRGLVLFTSYMMLREAEKRLSSLLEGKNIRVLAQGISGSRDAILDHFRRDAHSILLGTHSFWEGIDVVGESLSCLVLARLPFAVFTDPVIEARCEQVEARGKNAFTGYSIPGAVIRFRQGFGRLIRHRTDRGLVIVADRRLVARGYGHWFRASIPTPVRPVPDRPRFLALIKKFFNAEPPTPDR